MNKEDKPYEMNQYGDDSVQIGTVTGGTVNINLPIPMRANTSFPRYISERPFDITASFVGRQGLIDEIIENIYLQQSVLLSGIGGIGKTEVAKAVLKTIESTPSSRSGIHEIAWVNYDNKDIRFSIVKSLFNTKKIENIEDAWSEVCLIISKNRQRLLLVIDNIENDEDCNLLRLADLPCRVFATGRIESLSSLLPISLNELSIEDCITLFLHFYTRKDISLPTLKKIIELADKHTITVELLSKVADLEEESLEIFYDKLVKYGFKLSLEAVSVGHERLNKETHIINQLSILFSVCRLNPSLTYLLIMISVIPSLPFTFNNAKKWFNQSNRKSIMQLVRTGWLIKLKRSNNSLFIMHSVIAAAIREQFKDELYATCRSFIAALTSELKYDRDEHGTEKIGLIQFSWSVNDLLEGHLVDEFDADFLYFLARVYTDIANYDQALMLLKRSVHIYRKDKVINTNKLCAAYNSLGLIYQEMSLLKYAVTQYKIIFSILHKYTLEDSFKASVYNNVGLVHLKLYDNKAYWYFEKAYQLAKRAFGEGDTETLKIYFNIGNGKAESGDYAGALAIYKSVINKEETIFGKNHLRVATTYNSIGNFLYDLGLFNEAEVYLADALAIRQEKLGIEHPATTDTLNTLGLIYLRQGNNTEARSCFEIVRNYNIKTYGEIHPEVAVAYNNLGLAAFNEDDYENALRQYKKAIEIYQAFGWDNSEDVVVTINNIGYIYNETGNPKKALEYFKDALKIIEKSPNKLLDELAQTYNNMAVVYFALDLPNEAHQYFKASIEHRIMCWSEKHISLAPTYNNYALLLDKEGDLKNALIYLKKSRELLIEAFGNDSPNLKIVDGHIARIMAKI